MERGGFLPDQRTIFCARHHPRTRQMGRASILLGGACSPHRHTPDIEHRQHREECLTILTQATPLTLHSTPPQPNQHTRPKPLAPRHTLSLRHRMFQQQRRHRLDIRVYTAITYQRELLHHPIARRRETHRRIHPPPVASTTTAGTPKQHPRQHRP